MPFSAGATAAAGLSTGATLGVAAGVIAAEELIRKYVGRGRKAADAWVNGGNGQNDFLKNVLEPAAEIAKTDPAKAAALTEEGWKTFLQGADAYAAKGKNQARAVQQNLLKTPEFMGTVSTLLGKDPLGAEFTSGPNISRILTSAAQAINPGGRTSSFSINPLAQASQSLGINPPISSNLVGQTGQSGNVGWLTPRTTGIPLWGSPFGNNGGKISINDTIFGNKRGASGGTSVGGAPTGDGGFDTGGGSNLPTNPNDPNQKQKHWWDQFVDPKFLLGVGTSLFGGIANARAARNAGNAQATAAERAAQLQADSAKNSLDFAREVYGNQRQDNAPFLTAGTNALGEIQHLIGPGGDLSKDFVAPTAEDVRTRPGYQLELGEAQKALERATRGVTSGATVKAAGRFGADFADSKYGTALNQDMNIFQTNRQNRLNPLFQLAGFGPGAVGANNSSGNNAVNTNTNVLSNLADNTGQLGIDAATARGYGGVNSTNALVAALTQISNLAQQRQAQTRSSY